MTDYKQLCAELTEALHRYQCWYIEDNGASLSHLEELLRRADAALAESEPAGATDEELLQVFDTVCLSEGGMVDEIHLRGLRAVLARWGNHPGSLDSSTQPS